MCSIIPENSREVVKPAQRSGSELESICKMCCFFSISTAPLVAPYITITELDTGSPGIAPAEEAECFPIGWDITGIGQSHFSQIDLVFRDHVCCTIFG